MHDQEESRLEQVFEVLQSSPPEEAARALTLLERAGIEEHGDAGMKGSSVSQQAIEA